MVLFYLFIQYYAVLKEITKLISPTYRVRYDGAITFI